MLPFAGHMQGHRHAGTQPHRPCSLETSTTLLLWHRVELLLSPFKKHSQENPPSVMWAGGGSACAQHAESISRIFGDCHLVTVPSHLRAVQEKRLRCQVPLPNPQQLSPCSLGGPDCSAKHLDRQLPNWAQGTAPPAQQALPLLPVPWLPSNTRDSQAVTASSCISSPWLAFAGDTVFLYHLGYRTYHLSWCGSHFT